MIKKTLLTTGLAGLVSGYYKKSEVETNLENY